MNDQREQLLTRVRKALEVPAEKPAGHHDQASEPRIAGEHSATEWLPFVGATAEERLALYAKNAKELTADFRLIEGGIPALVSELREIAETEGWTGVATHAGELTEAAAGSLGLPVVRTECGYDVDALEKCSAGITACEALVAQTGSVLVTSRSSGGRALSVLPPHHVVVARREQIVADMTEAYALLASRYAQSGYPSMISFISGPSRTGDIERILVLGAHGPKRLTVLCI
ncbi:MAG: lactate utilization protein C [Chthoniobacteraceae bacterium]